MAGLLNRETSSPLPLRSSSVWADIRGFTARTTAALTYYNDHRVEIEAIFVMPLDFSSHVVEFEANIEGRYLFVDIENENESEKKTAIYDFEPRNDDKFSISIGRLSPWILIQVQVTVITEIFWMSCNSALEFLLPSVFTPRIVSDLSKYEEMKNKDPSMRLAPCIPAISTLGYSLEIEVSIEAPCRVTRVSSGTYPIQFESLAQDDDSAKIRVQLPENFKHVDKDFHLSFLLEKPREPFIYIEQARHTHTNEFGEKNPISNIMNNPVLMLSYSPDFSTLQREETMGTSEFIFMIDRSGSMNGNLINSAKETILLFLHSLSSNAYFNVLSFGTYFQSLFKESQPYSQANLEEACCYVRKIRADMGGTSLLEPLEWIFNGPVRKAVPRQIFMVTDGVVTDSSKVIECVKKRSHLTRIFTFGLGENICLPLLRDLALITHGRTEVIPVGERLQPKVIEKIQVALQPAVTNLRASWILPDGYDVIYTPEHIPPLFDGDRLTMYAILARRKDLEATSNDKRSQRSSTDSVKEFWFEEDEFEVELICDDRSTKDILSKSTSTPSDISHHSLIGNRLDLHQSQEADDFNDNEVFLTEEEAERLTESNSWQHGKRSSIDRVQSWRVSRNPDSVESDNTLGVPLYEVQWRSAERLTSKTPTGSTFKESHFSASTGDIRSHYILCRDGGSQDHCVESLPKYLAHPGYPTRHNSARSNEGRSPVQKLCTELPYWDTLPNMDNIKASDYPLAGGCHKVSEDRRSVKSLELGYGKPLNHDSECLDDALPTWCHSIKGIQSSVEEDIEMKGYDANTLRKEARRLKQSLSDDHVNTHFIEESNFQTICQMLEVLVLDKRRRLIDYILQQEEFVKCSWGREHDRYKQSLVESCNRRDSGLGNRSSSEPKSDHEEDAMMSVMHNRLDPKRNNNGLVSKSSSGYFEQEKFPDDRHMHVSKTDLYKRQHSDDCHSERSGKSNKSLGRPHSGLEAEFSSDYVAGKFGRSEATGAFYDRTRSVTSDAASGKSCRTSSLSNDNVAERKYAASQGSNRLSASAEHISRRKSRDDRVASARSEDTLRKRKSRDRSVDDGNVTQEAQSSPQRSPGPTDGQNKSVFSSFIDGVRNLASRLSERTDQGTSKETNSRTAISGIFSRQNTGDTKSSKGALDRQSSAADIEGKASRSGTTKSDETRPDDRIHSKRRQLQSIGRLANSMSLDKQSEKLPVNRQSSMKYAKPLLERSRTISSSFMHDLGDGEEISGDNVALNPNQGMIYLTGNVGRRLFKRLIPFKLALDQENNTEKPFEPTIHQLAAKSIILDLERQLEENTSLNFDGKEYITTLIGEVSRSAKVASKYSVLVVIDDKCKEQEAVFIKKFTKRRGRSLSHRSMQNTTELKAESPPMYDIQRKEVKQIEFGNKTHKIMTTKFTLFTPKPPKKSTLLSPASASRHTLLVQKRLFESSGYMKMVDIQCSDGFWMLNEELADVIPAPLAKLRQSCPFVDPTFDLNNDKEIHKGLELSEVYEKIWATSLAVKWLLRSWAQYKAEWDLVIQKASKWMKFQRLPAGFGIDDINLMAQQSLGVMLSNSRKSSNH